MDPGAAQPSELLEEAFWFFDKDGDGRITLEEIKTAIGNLGREIADEELRDMIREVDANGNGTIELNEFMDFMGWKIKDSEVEYIREAFKLVDKDQNGFITETELMHVMMNLGEENLTSEDILQMIEEADMDGDGQVNFDEFARMAS